MQYILLLRGINVGGKNKINMSELKEQLVRLGLRDIVTYINSGNIIFHSNDTTQNLRKMLHDFFQKQYTFDIRFSLLTAEEYRRDAERLPTWWDESLARKDVLFYTKELDTEKLIDNVKQLELYNEVVHIGEHALFWGKYDESEYLKTNYHKWLMKQPFYKHITVRNDKTYQKIKTLISTQV